MGNINSIIDFTGHCRRCGLKVTNNQHIHTCTSPNNEIKFFAGRPLANIYNIKDFPYPSESLRMTATEALKEIKDLCDDGKGESIVEIRILRPDELKG